MKTVIVLAALVALCYSAPQEGIYSSNTREIPIIRQEQEINPDGSYAWSYETGDGTNAEARGYLKNAGVENGEAEVAEGSFSYISPEGIAISLKYVADEYGFRPEATHLP